MALSTVHTVRGGARTSYVGDDDDGCEFHRRRRADAAGTAADHLIYFDRLILTPEVVVIWV